MALNDIVADIGNYVDVPASAEAMQDYSNNKSNSSKYSKSTLASKLRKITATGALLAALSGCPSPTGPTPSNGNGQEQPAPIEIVVSGLAGKVDNQRVDVRPDKNYLDFDINVENGSLADVYWRQGSVFGTGSYSDGRFTFDNLPDTGYFDVLVDATNNGDVETKTVSGLLSGPERAYFIGDENGFNSEFGSLSEALDLGAYTDDFGEFTAGDFDMDYAFENLPFHNYIVDSTGVAVGAKDNDYFVVARHQSGTYKIFSITESEHDTIIDLLNE